MIRLQPKPLSAQDFAPFGRVIEARGSPASAMNEGTFARFDNLAQIETRAEVKDPTKAKTHAQTAGDAACPSISIVRSRSAASLPHSFDLVECHPLCSQAFVPLSEFEFLVVVAKQGPPPGAAELCAFVTNGRQGISYDAGTWHMPLIALAPDQDFLVVDQAERPGNLREHRLEEQITLCEPS